MVLPLFDAVSHPVEAHVDGSRSTLLGGAVDDAGSGRVVDGDRRCRLFMVHFFEHGPDVCALLTVVEKASGFGFHGRREDIFHDAAID